MATLPLPINGTPSQQGPLGPDPAIQPDVAYLNHGVLNACGGGAEPYLQEPPHPSVEAPFDGKGKGARGFCGPPGFVPSNGPRGSFGKGAGLGKGVDWEPPGKGAAAAWGKGGVFSGKGSDFGKGGGGGKGGAKGRGKGSAGWGKGGASSMPVYHFPPSFVADPPAVHPAMSYGYQGYPPMGPPPQFHADTYRPSPVPGPRQYPTTPQMPGTYAIPSTPQLHTPPQPIHQPFASGASSGSANASAQMDDAHCSMESNPGKTAAVVWLHGLGDTSAGWCHLEPRFAAALPHIKWVFPDAPKQPVTCHSGRVMTSWFDIHRIPVQLHEPDCPAGMLESVAKLHEMVDGLVAEGIPAERIVVGGFSQGSAIAQHAGYTCQKKLAGIVGFSGWGMQRNEIGVLLRQGANLTTPTLLCHGTKDRVVMFALGKASYENLVAQGKENVQFKEYWMAHVSCPQELSDLGEFLAAALPPH